MKPQENKIKPVILAVDDKPELLKSLVYMLNDEYTVIAVTSAVAAIKAVRSHTPALFLFDVEMPDLNGFELSSLMRKHEEFKKTPIIFLTSMSSRDDVIAAVQSGGNDYIIKPVEKEFLLAKIARYLK